MKFRILLLLLCLATFGLATAQSPSPPPSDETTQVIAEDIALANHSGVIVEDIILDDYGPGLLAFNDQPSGEVLPFKRDPSTITSDEVYSEPDPGLMASNLQLPDADDDPTPTDDDPFDLWGWLSSFLAGLVPESVLGYLGAFLLVGETVVRLTPTTVDDKWFLWVKRIIDTILPSKQKGGGSFPKADKTPI
jgi:hypothetical protein